MMLQVALPRTLTTCADSPSFRKESGICWTDTLGVRAAFAAALAIAVSMMFSLHLLDAYNRKMLHQIDLHGTLGNFLYATGNFSKFHHIYFETSRTPAEMPRARRRLVRRRGERSNRKPALRPFLPASVETARKYFPH